MLLRLLPLFCALFCTGNSLAQEPVNIPGLPGKLAASGYWFPAKESRPAPAIIGLHGCSGALDNKGQLAPKWKELAVWLNREGMHFLVIDSFTPRGQKSICEILSRLRTINETDRREDVFAAIQWLANRAEVDSRRIVVAGWSHGAQTVLKTLDRSDAFVSKQPIQPRAAVAYYPGCSAINRQSDYALSAPLLLMIGESDDWTPAKACVRLEQKLQNNKQETSLELIVYPSSYHGFDGTTAVHVRPNVANTRSGTATLGGNPEARVKSRVRLFDYLAEQLDRPLRLSHEARFLSHTSAVPPASGFASIDNLAAVPIVEKGKSRYAYYLSQPKPKAFVVTNKGGWYLSTDNVHAMQNALGHCPTNTKCWLYAVDDQVVWSSDPDKRIAQPLPAD